MGGDSALGPQGVCFESFYEAPGICLGGKAD